MPVDIVFLLALGHFAHPKSQWLTKLCYGLAIARGVQVLFSTYLGLLLGAK